MTTTTKLTIFENKVIYQDANKVIWSIDVNKIKFITEYTTPYGPVEDDWFFVFGIAVDEWRCAPTLAIDHETFWKEISPKLNCELAPNLFWSTNWESSTIFPKHLDGQKAFNIITVKEPAENLFQRFMSYFKRPKIRLELVENIKELFDK